MIRRKTAMNLMKEPNKYYVTENSLKQTQCYDLNYNSVESYRQWLKWVGSSLSFHCVSLHVDQLSQLEVQLLTWHCVHFTYTTTQHVKKKKCSTRAEYWNFWDESLAEI